MHFQLRIQQAPAIFELQIHKEKSQALLEFLTPEDASAALCLDGMSFSGSNLKLRRPKDYANVTVRIITMLFSDFTESIVDIDL